MLTGDDHLLCCRGQQLVRQTAAQQKVEARAHALEAAAAQTATELGGVCVASHFCWQAPARASMHRDSTNACTPLLPTARIVLLQCRQQERDTLRKQLQDESLQLGDCTVKLEALTQARLPPLYLQFLLM